MQLAQTQSSADTGAWCGVTKKEFDELAREFDKKQLTATGDAAKLREAVEESRRIASDLGGCRLNDYWKLNEIVRVCEAALAATEKEGGL